MLQIRDLTCRVGGRTLLDGASLTLPTGQRMGLVGRNGTGKSTLLRLIEGEITPDAGEVVLHKRARVGSVAQQAPSGRQTLTDFVLAADRERAALLAEHSDDPARIAAIHDRLVDIDAHSAPARAAAILAGLGFDAAAQARPLDDFSGGWRMRVALAATLFANPDLLLLDEPSNHLDLEARLWLEGFLARYRGTLLLVSHDRGLLNAVAQAIAHLDNRRLTVYRGDYDTFERTLRERLALQAAQHAKQLAQRRKIQAFVDRFRYKASKARQAQSRLKALARMQDAAPLRADTEVAFDFPDPEPLPPPLLTLDRASAGYAADAPVLRDLDLRIDMDDRIALLGANGNGKTTLLRLLAGDLQPLAGHRRKSPKLQVGHFAQDQAQAFAPRDTPVRHLARLLPNASVTQLRAHLGRFGLSQDKAEVAIGDLSGGERARLLLACVTRAAPHLLLLDEPTNHLDIDARRALISALNAWSGAVVLVTHDPDLVAACADRLWLVADGSCRAYDGDLDDYRKLLLEQRRAGAGETREAAVPRASRKAARQAGAQSRAALQPLRRAARSAERRLEELSAERKALQARMADPDLYNGPATALADLQKRLHAVEQAIAAAEADWLDAQEGLEGAAGPATGDR